MSVSEKERSYDELLLLARDSRSSRRRTTWWTTGLIASGMVASTAYVATVNQQLDSLKESADEASELNIRVVQVQQERDIVAAQRDAYRDSAKAFARIAAGRVQGSSTEAPTFEFPSETIPPGELSSVALANVVWIADGSRRFPMTHGDVLWIPEGKFWVRLEGQPPTTEQIVGTNETPRNMTVFLGGTPSVLGEKEETYDMREHFGTWYQRPVTGRQTADCVHLVLHEETNRPGFGKSFTDIEVIYVNDPGANKCEAGRYWKSNPPPE